MNKLIIMILIIISTTANADKWTQADTNREIVYNVFHVIDWGQTRYISENCQSIYERNPLLSSCPTHKEVDEYFVAMSLLHFTISKLLPSEYRRTWQYITIGAQSGTVSSNYNLGLKVSF